MRVAILGDGLLGQTLASVMAGRDEWTIDLIGHDRLEIWDPRSVDDVVRSFDVAINTVAFHRLMECEADQTKARLVNTEGARFVAMRVPAVYISTDYVFNDKGPHDECLPGEEPRSAYGRSKLGGEIATLEHGGIVVRVSGLYGRYPSHKGPSFPEAVLTNLSEPMRLPNDQRFSPTFADDAARRIADLALRLADGDDFESAGGRIFHAANAGSTTWAEFARNVLEAYGVSRRVDDYKARDPLRPRNSVLKSTTLPPLRHWRLALDEWVAWRKRNTYVSPLREEARR